MRILITRPASLAIGLTQKITALGDIAELFPVIDIQKTPHQRALKSAIQTLDQQDIAIFVSQNAAHYGMAAIQKHWSTLPNIVWAAIGPSTAQALQHDGIAHVLVPHTPPYESESLLKLPIFQSLESKSILIFRGNGGRELLSTVLSARGATVEVIEVYQRVLPTFDRVERLKNWYHSPIDVIVTTSKDSLYNLVHLLGDFMDNLREIPIIVVGSRMLELAKELKFKYPLTATDADDASIIKVLKVFKDNQM